MVLLNKAQCLALKQLISKVELDELQLTELPDEEVHVVMSDMQDNSTKLALDKWGQGRLIP